MNSCSCPARDQPLSSRKPRCEGVAPCAKLSAVETLRLKRIQLPTHVDELLHAFVRSAGIVPEDAYMVRDRNSLTEGIRDRILKAERNGRSWECWSDSIHTWLFTAEMSLDQSRERGTPVLQVSQFDEEGQLQETGSYVSDQRARWGRCSD